MFFLGNPTSALSWSMLTVFTDGTWGHQSSKRMDNTLALWDARWKLMTPTCFGLGQDKRDPPFCRAWPRMHSSASHACPRPSNEVPGTGSSLSKSGATAIGRKGRQGWKLGTLVSQATMTEWGDAQKNLVRISFKFDPYSVSNYFWWLMRWHDMTCATRCIIETKWAVGHLMITIIL